MQNPKNEYDANVEGLIIQTRIIADQLAKMDLEGQASQAYQLALACKKLRRPEVAEAMDKARLKRCAQS